MIVFKDGPSSIEKANYLLEIARKLEKDRIDIQTKDFCVARAKELLDK